MKTKVTSQLKHEATQFRLQFACPNCAYFDDVHDRCSEGYPHDEHRSERLDEPEVLFCKLFEAS